MPLSEYTKARIAGIRAGTIEPDTGIEKHFRRVCLGKSVPVTPEEREWYEFVQRDPAAEARENERRSHEETMRRIVEEAHEARLRQQQSFAEAERLQIVVEEQQRLIKSLKARLEALTPPVEVKPLFTEPREADLVGSICRVCNGDGGAKGECWKCKGSGWIK
jgi:hypothetical protein